VADVRQAVPADREGVVGTIAAAFVSDPAWTFIAGRGDAVVSELFAGALFDLRVVDGGVWITDDLTAASMWEEPGGTSLSTDMSAAVWTRFREQVGEGVWERLALYDRAVEAAMPPEEFWYLGTLATRPDRQGRGLARAVTAPALAIADAAGLPACLETSNPGNKAVYRRLGFEHTADVEVPDGPATWWLTRQPR